MPWRRDCQRERTFFTLLLLTFFPHRWTNQIPRCPRRPANPSPYLARVASRSSHSLAIPYLNTCVHNYNLTLPCLTTLPADWTFSHSPIRLLPGVSSTRPRERACRSLPTATPPTRRVCQRELSSSPPPLPTPPHDASLFCSLSPADPEPRLLKETVPPMRASFLIRPMDRQCSYE